MIFAARALKNTTRKLFNALGYDVVSLDRLASAPVPPTGEDRLVAAILARGIDKVFDVGANAGQYGRLLRRCGFQGPIISFEPLAGPFACLAKMASDDGNWIALNLALGRAEGEAVINVSKNSVSSSFLPLQASFLAGEPGLACEDQQRARLGTLDSFYFRYAAAYDKVLIKLDVQGYEDEVLGGSAEALQHALAVQLEMSLVPIYEGERLLYERVLDMKTLGFRLFDMQDVFRDGNSGRLLQVDGLFFREISLRA
jgi:FkbM family methyltransferase